MATYRQYCPVAVASEILAERWNPLIVRNLMFGADTFSAIANGVPSMSRSMLIKRLGELQRAGVIETQLKRDGRGYNYRHRPRRGNYCSGVVGPTVGGGNERTMRSRLRAVGLVSGATRSILPTGRPGNGCFHVPRRESQQSAVLDIDRAS